MRKLRDEDITFIGKILSDRVREIDKTIYEWKFNPLHQSEIKSMKKERTKLLKTIGRLAGEGN